MCTTYVTTLTHSTHSSKYNEHGNFYSWHYSELHDFIRMVRNQVRKTFSLNLCCCPLEILVSESCNALFGKLELPRIYELIPKVVLWECCGSKIFISGIHPHYICSLTSRNINTALMLLVLELTAAVQRGPGGSDRKSVVLPCLSPVGLLCLFPMGPAALTVAGIRGG